MKSQNLTRGWEAQRWRKTDMGNHHVNMGKILGYHHIMFILPSADVAFCYRMLSAATAHEFEPSVQHSRHPTFQPWIPVQVVIVWTSLVHLCLSGSGSVQWWQDWSDWSHPFCEWLLANCAILSWNDEKIKKISWFSKQRPMNSWLSSQNIWNSYLILCVQETFFRCLAVRVEFRKAPSFLFDMIWVFPLWDCYLEFLAVMH